MLTGLVVVALSGVSSAAAILLVLRYAKELRLVQAPNARSSHRKPTPAGGGIGVVAGSTIAALFVASQQAWPTLWFVVFGLLLAAIGVWDDVDPRPAALRLGVQVAAVAVTLALAFPPSLLSTALRIGLPDPVVLAGLTLLVVYWINLFNFMDGVDGIAGSEALFLLLAPLCLALVASSGITATPFYWWILATAVATLVFIGFNWQPARIFMGDGGSLFLGFTTAMFALIEIGGGWISVWQALIMPACFVTDATITLLRRAARGEAVMSAHRLHAYQHLSRRFGSHQRVTLGLTAINLIWLLPLAFAAGTLPDLAPYLAAAAYLPLIALVVFAGAGRPEHV